MPLKLGVDGVLYRYRYALFVSVAVMVVALIAGGLWYDRSRLPDDPGLAVEPSKRTEQTEAPQVLVVGDSYSRGSGSGGASGNWTRQLAGLLYNSGNRIELDVRALDTAGFTSRSSGGVNFEEELRSGLTESTDYVIFFGSRYDVGMDVSQSAKSAVSVARSISSDVGVMIVGPAWIDSNIPAEFLQLRDSLRATADEVGAVFVDPIGEGWFSGDDAGLIGVDKIHPTNRGQVYIANKMFDPVSALITSG